ncbi:hypothetical protein HAX54_040698 [Datura stramonium]|uniref:DUF7915 domain-containing protein n=1 Tax=Datura stramonium TaxID=4076 RepID=A0ABS8VT27_DATST|nr:hypothetical protein [Datura stramonium]
MASELASTKDVVNAGILSQASVALEITLPLRMLRNSFSAAVCSQTGVWSLLGKRLELPTAEIEGTVERKHLKKKRQTSMRPVTVEQNDDDSGFQQLAFLAQGCNRVRLFQELYLYFLGHDLVVLEKHVVYSLTKEKTASCFYIMQCTQSISLDIQIPVKEIFERVHVVKRNSGNWSTTDVVGVLICFPYASIMSTFF